MGRLVWPSLCLSLCCVSLCILCYLCVPDCKTGFPFGTIKWNWPELNVSCCGRPEEAKTRRSPNESLDGWRIGYRCAVSLCHFTHRRSEGHLIGRVDMGGVCADWVGWWVLTWQMVTEEWVGEREGLPCYIYTVATFWTDTTPMLSRSHANDAHHCNLLSVQHWVTLRLWWERGGWRSKDDHAPSSGHDK